MINFIKIVRALMLVGASLITTVQGTYGWIEKPSSNSINAAPHSMQQQQQMPVKLPGSGFITGTTDTPKPDYSLIAAMIYAENNLPSPYDPWYNKTSRACEYLLTDPYSCCSIFCGCEGADEGARQLEQLRLQYCDKDASQLTLGKLPVAHRPDAVAIMQAVDEHITDVLGTYFVYDEQSSALEQISDRLDSRCLESSVFCWMCVGLLDPTKLSTLAIPWCVAAGSTCCLSRAAVVVDYM